MYERVNGKRFLAAIIDSIIVGVIGSVPTLIYMFTYGIDNFANSLFQMSGTGPLGMDMTDEGIAFMFIATIIGAVIGIVWFVIIPAKSNGQTIGKKVMNIKAIDEAGNNPSFKQHFVRAIQNWGTYVSCITVFFALVNYTLFIGVNAALSNVVSLIALVSYIMVLVKTDGRGLHDIITNTTVVSADVNFQKSFHEKATSLGEWAEVETEEKKSQDDDWYI